jgi:hypothetical protein
VLKVLKVI